MKKINTLARWLRAVIILPFNALVVIPALVLWLSGWKFAIVGGWRCIVGGLLFAVGLPIAAWTMVLFHRIGKGTPAPWDPPQKLVVAGPYRYMRNPMLTSVFIMLAAEVLLTWSLALLVLFLIFLCVNMLYFPLFEEKQLLRRFGEDYAKYKANVPRYLPRIKPWTGSD